MILVGLDFRDDSWAALRHAQSLSRAMGLPLEVLHVCEYCEADRWRPGAEDLMGLEAAGFPVTQIRVRRGVPWVELVRYAKEQRAWLIVAGRHGASGFQPLALGSTAQHLANTSRDPVLLVSGPSERRSVAGRRRTEELGPSPGIDERSNGSPTPSEVS